MFIFEDKMYGGYGQPGPGGQPAPGGYGQPSAPGGYGPPMGYGVNPEVQQFFQAVDADRTGRVNMKELQAALINGQGNNFSDSVCSLMIQVFGKEQKGTININEFQYLYQYVNNWISTFKTYDRDDSGYIEEAELATALQQMGYRFSPQFYKTVLFNTANKTQVTVDELIEFCMKLQRFTELFRGKDIEQKGVITIGYEEFCALCLTSFN